MKFTPHLLMLKRTSLNLFVILLGVFFILGSGGNPEITIQGDNPATVQQGSVYVDAGATATDDDGPRQVSVTGLPIDTSVLGAHTVTYSVYGGEGQLITAERIVNVVKDTVTAVPNQAPIANNITANTNEDKAIDIALVATDADGDNLAYVILSNPQHGSVSLNGSVATYTPTASYSGADSFTYKVNDGQIDSQAATVSIEVKSLPNSIPVAQSGSSATNMNKAVNIELIATDSDGDLLTFAIVGQPNNGSLSAVDGNKVTYTPNNNYTGSDSFSFNANDGTSNSNVATINLDIAPLKRGKIIDSAITNLPYKVGDYEGVTDSEGYFKYDYDGQDIYFNLGNIKLGSAKTQSVITTINVSKSQSALDAKNVELLQFLQTIDTDNDPSNGINISSEAHEYEYADEIDFSKEGVVAVNVLTNLGWQSVEIVGQDDAIKHFLETLDSSEDLQSYCEIIDTGFLNSFDRDTNDCLQLKYRDAYINLIKPLIAADSYSIANLINKTDSSREWNRQIANQMLQAKKIFQYTKLIGSSNVTKVGQATLRKELLVHITGAGLSSLLGEEYGQIWSTTFFSALSAPAVLAGDKAAFLDIISSSADLLWAAAVDTKSAWSLNQQTEKANELHITDYVLVYYFNHEADQTEIMASLGLSGNFNWTDVVEAIATKKGYNNGLVSESYNTDVIIKMVHGYISLAEKVVGEDFTYINTISENSALSADSSYQAFLDKFSSERINRSAISQSDLAINAKTYYKEAYLSQRIYEESPATEGSSKDQWVLSDYHCTDSGLIAGLYQREGKEEYILSFGGTTATCLKPNNDAYWESFLFEFYKRTSSVIDIAADLFLFSNFPYKLNQGRDALDYLETDSIKNLLAAGKIKKITGHSLGGGLASYAGLYAGVDVVTFNPAPMPFSEESLSLFIDKNKLKNIKFTSNGVVSNFDFVNEDGIVNIMALGDPVSLVSLELVALQKYANVNPILNDWYLNPVKILFAIHPDTQLDYLIPGEQIFLPVNYGSTFAQHSMDNLLGTYKLYNKDFDGDGVLDVMDDFPSDPLYYLDSNGDGLPNKWEEEHGLDPNAANNSLGDLDTDNLSNLAEFINKTNPQVPDTDGDGMPDGWEVANSLNPLLNDASADKDGDGISNLLEYNDGTSALDPEDFFRPEATGAFKSNGQSINPIEIKLSWDAIDQAESYVVCYSTESLSEMPADGLKSCGQYQNAKWISEISGTSVSISSDLVSGETYYFRMAAVRSGKVGLASEQIIVVLDHNSAIDLTAGLVAHYAFEQNGLDSSSNQFNATELNVTYIDGVKGKAAHLPNGNSLLFASHDWPTLQDFTISMFVKLDEYASDASSQSPVGNVLVSFDQNEQGAGLENALELALESEYSNELEKRYLSAHIADEQEIFSKVTPSGFLKEWTSLIFVREGDRVKVYVDGTLYHSYDRPTPASFTPGNLAIGKNVFLLKEGMSLFGAIDELRIYNKSVSLAEIEALSGQTIVVEMGSGPLNDTGITQCANQSQNNLACPVSSHPNQDAQIGRDATHNDDSDGHAGFSFTKISSSGAELPASATQWSCVKDNVTDLIWEVKTDDGGLHDKNNSYTWYNPNNTTNGGHAGTENGDNDTDSFVTNTNNAGYCGANDWRMPNREELKSLVDYSIAYPGPTIDTAYFPNDTSAVVWSSSPFAYSSGIAWYINFNYGNGNAGDKGNSLRVRLVRSGQ